MKRSLFFSLWVVAVMAFTPLGRAAPAPEGQVVDGIAAIVNGDIITYSQVRDLVEPRERLLRSQFQGQELIAKITEVRKAALKDLIDRQLIIQAFDKDGLAIPEHYVDEEIKQVIRENFGGDRHTFIKTLQAQNFSLTEFKKMETDKIKVQAMRGKNAHPVTVISPNKVDEYYRAHRDQFSSKEEVKLRMIMIPGSQTNAASQKALAEEIRSKLLHGADFAKMAQIYSEDSTRDLGGDWGWIEPKTLAPELEKVAFSLRTGKISDIVELGGNYYILKADEKRGGVARPLAEVRTEIQKRLQQEESMRVHDRWVAGLREKAYIKTF